MKHVSFRQYYTEASNKESSKEVVFTFGRFSPPTTGHEKLIDKVASEASGNHYRIFASHSYDKKKNPLKYDDKIKFMRKMFPKHGRNIVHTNEVKNALAALVYLYKQGYTRATMVVGSDRVKEFDALLNKYNGVDARHGTYNFEGGIKVISAGDRDPDSDGVDGMSASKMRAAAVEGDFAKFTTGLTKSLSNSDKKNLYNTIRSEMGVSEAISHDFNEHMAPVSEKREKYISGELFGIGEMVSSEEYPHERLQITERKCNYVIARLESTHEEVKCWVESLEPVEQASISPVDRYKEKIKKELTDISEAFGVSESILMSRYNKKINAGKRALTALQEIKSEIKKNGTI